MTTTAVAESIDQFRERFTRIEQEVAKVHRRPRRDRRRRPHLPASSAATRCSKASPASARPPSSARLAEALAPEVQPHPVHARPDAGRHHRHQRHHRGRPTATRASSSSRARSSPRSCWPTRSTAPRPRRSRPCSRRCRSSSVTVGGDDPQARGAVLRHGHAEPDRAGGHLPAARGPARPLLLQARGRLLRPRGAERDPRPHDRATTADGRAGDRRRQILADAGPGARGADRPAGAGLRRSGCVLATHPAARVRRAGVAKQYIRCGASPRGAQALVLAARCAPLVDGGRFNVSFEDIRSAARRRCGTGSCSTSRAEADEISTDTIVTEMLAQVSAG